MGRTSDVGPVWRELGASWYYSGYEPRIVVGLLVAPGVPHVPAPFEVRTSRAEYLPIPGGSAIHVVTAQASEDRPSWPSLSEWARQEQVPEGSMLLVFPTAPSEVVTVARNWLSLIDEEHRLPEEEGHGLYLSFEVGDDWHTFPHFLLGEEALWKAFDRSRPSRATEQHLGQVMEAKNLGQVVIERFLESGQRSYGAAVQALCDLVVRTMVTDKVFTLRSLVADARVD